jgi:uncharacterized protein YjiS (DUF1127 family)
MGLFQPHGGYGCRHGQAAVTFPAGKIAPRKNRQNDQTFPTGKVFSCADFAGIAPVKPCNHCMAARQSRQLCCAAALLNLGQDKQTKAKGAVMKVLHKMRSAMQKRAAYRQLKHEIATMPQEVAIDLGLFREDAAKIASKAIYG